MAGVTSNKLFTVATGTSDLRLQGGANRSIHNRIAVGSPFKACIWTCLMIASP